MSALNKAYLNSPPKEIDGEMHLRYYRHRSIESNEIICIILPSHSYHSLIEINKFIKIIVHEGDAVLCQLLPMALMMNWSVAFATENIIIE